MGEQHEINEIDIYIYIQIHIMSSFVAAFVRSTCARFRMLQTLQVLFVASDSRDSGDSKQGSKPSLTV